MPRSASALCPAAAVGPALPTAEVGEEVWYGIVEV
jgi:hypothetical protein